MYADIFASEDANLNDIWDSIEKGIKRRGDRRDQAFNDARAILKEYIELRDNQILQHNLGERSFLRVIGKLREKVTALEEKVKLYDEEVSALREENKELKSQLADISEWLDQEHGICLPK